MGMLTCRYFSMKVTSYNLLLFWNRERLKFHDFADETCLSKFCQIYCFCTSKYNSGVKFEVLM